MDAVRLAWRLCFALTSYNNGSTCRILAWKMRSMTQPRFGISSGSIWALRQPTGTIVDATIIHAPSSTKNSSGERDPEMHQTKKGNQWYFGLKAHIGVDSKEGVVHSVCTSAASV